MNSQGLRIGRLRGAPIYLKPSWFIFTALIIGVYGSHLASWRTLTTAQGYTAALVLAASLALGVLAHELAHALVGTVRGLKLYSIHLTIWGGSTRLTVGTPTTSILVSLAGPLVNLVLAGACQLIWLANPGPWTLGLAISAQANLAIGIFNLLPAYPLDGGHTLQAILTAATGSLLTATRIVAYTGYALAALALAAGIYLYSTGSTFTALAAGAIAYFLFSSARERLRFITFDDRGDATAPRI